MEMAEKKLVLHINLCDGVIINPSNRGFSSVDQLINSWLADNANGILTAENEWRPLGTSSEVVNSSTLTYT